MQLTLPKADIQIIHPFLLTFIELIVPKLDIVKMTILLHLLMAIINLTGLLQRKD